jgi:hypothetical protein
VVECVVAECVAAGAGDNARLSGELAPLAGHQLTFNADAMPRGQRH